ncbi:MAG TPA: hypothetical protein VE994_10180 [Terriglobales bacterium]|nr:hypothetical protein [Terriglobales bacterium]
MIDVEEVREKGSALIVAGWVACLFNALILFFLPTAVRQGNHASFLVVMSVLVVIGFALVIAGYVIRKSARI